MRTPHPSVVGLVEVWHRAEGWGVLRTPDGLSIWCHFSHLVMDGYKELEAGRPIRFDDETPGQDGYDGRVLTSAHPVDGGSAEARRDARPQPMDTSGAYASDLAITFDDE